MTIKAFDRTNLNRLNNILRQLQRDNEDLRNQIKTLNGNSVVVEKRKSGEMYVPQSNIVGYQRDDGTTDLYVDEEGEQINIGIPNSGKVFKTNAAQAIPSSYFLDLRGAKVSAYVWNITADWATPHDNSSPWNIVGLPAISENNDVSIAGPIAGGRDQVGTLTSGWIYFFIIYNSITEDISSLSSESATAPTLPTGYDHFVRVSSSLLSPAGLWAARQVGNKIWVDEAVNYAKVGVDVATDVNIPVAIPPTAKTVQGGFGPTGAVAANRSAWIASANGICTVAQKFHSAGAAVDRLMYFDLPIVTAQYLTYYTQTTDENWLISIYSYEDDL